MAKKKYARQNSPLQTNITNSLRHKIVLIAYIYNYLKLNTFIYIIPYIWPFKQTVIEAVSYAEDKVLYACL